MPRADSLVRQHRHDECTSPRMLRSSRWAVAAFYVCVALLAFSYRHELTEWAQSVALGSNLDAALLLTAVLTLAVIVALPISPLYLLCGYAFGMAGVAITLTGGALGSIASFALARRVGERHDASVLDVLRDHGGRFLVWLRLSPFIPLTALNVGAGVVGVKWSTFLKSLPASGVAAILFTALGSVGDRALRGDFGAATGWVIVLAVISILGLVFAGWKTRRLIAEARAEGPEAPAFSEKPTRTVGVELEMIGIDVDAAANVVAEVLGGEITPSNELERCVDTPLGTFRIERDSKPLKDAADVAEDERDLLERALLLVTPMVPLEVVSPPMPVARIGVMDEIADGLRRAGARGTTRSVLDALGMHLNPEARDLSARGIRNTLRAYFLLRDRLRKEMRVDLTRKISPWIAPHSSAFVDLVMSAGYDPTIDQLVDDYLRLEPSRNRDLDLLPLLAHLRPDAVAAMDDERIKARPTYHYRLPNCALDDPEWSVVREWERWQLVERLAEDTECLAEWMRAWRETKDDLAVRWDALIEEVA